jgi:hypothetical protein
MTDKNIINLDEAKEKMGKPRNKMRFYPIDAEKIKTFDDFKIILKHMGLQLECYEGDKKYNDLKPFLKDQKPDPKNA